MRAIVNEYATQFTAVFQDLQITRLCIRSRTQTCSLLPMVKWSFLSTCWTLSILLYYDVRSAYLSSKHPLPLLLFFHFPAPYIPHEGTPNPSLSSFLCLIEVWFPLLYSCLLLYSSFSVSGIRLGMSVTPLILTSPWIVPPIPFSHFSSSITLRPFIPAIHAPLFKSTSTPRVTLTPYLPHDLDTTTLAIAVHPTITREETKTLGVKVSLKISAKPLLFYHHHLRFQES